MSRAETKGKQKEKSKKKDLVYYIIMLILLAVMIFSGIKVYLIASEYKEGTDAYNDIAEDVGANPDGDTDPAHLDTRLSLDWDKLKEKNDDVTAWIRCTGTIINYPIVQGNDNDYYLNHLLDGTWNGKGTIFVDARCARPFDGFLTIVYGHRMRDMGRSMFTILEDYLASKDPSFFSEHPVMEIYTPDENYDLQIFGAAIISAYDEFLYNNYISTEDEIQRYIDWIFAHNSLAGYDNSVSVMPTDSIVMMSTCMPTSADDDKRIVVWGKLVKAKNAAE